MKPANFTYSSCHPEDKKNSDMGFFFLKKAFRNLCIYIFSVSFNEMAEIFSTK